MPALKIRKIIMTKKIVN